MSVPAIVPLGLACSKENKFHLQWLMPIAAQNQPFPAHTQEFGQALVIQNLLAVLIPASPNGKFPALFVRRTLQFSILPWATPAFSSRDDAQMEPELSVPRYGQAFTLILGFELLKSQCWREPGGKRDPPKVFCVGT